MGVYKKFGIFSAIVILVILSFLCGEGCKRGLGIEEIESGLKLKLLNPSPYVVGLVDTLRLIWNGVDGIDGVELEIDTTNSFMFPILDTVVKDDTSFLWNIGGWDDSIFYVHVRPLLREGLPILPFGEVLKIIVRNSPPTLLRPDIRDTFSKQSQILLQWRSDYRVDSFRVQVFFVSDIDGVKIKLKKVKRSPLRTIANKIHSEDTLIIQDTIVKFADSVIIKSSVVGDIYWRVKAINDKESEWSKPDRFYVVYTIPTLVYPRNGEDLDNNTFIDNVRFVVSNVNKYIDTVGIKIYRDSMLINLVDSFSAKDTAFSWSPKTGGKLYWIACVDACSKADSFVLNGGKVFITEPSFDTVYMGFGDSIRLCWTSIYGASNYKVEFSNSSDFSYVLYDTTVSHPDTEIVVVYGSFLSTAGISVFARVRAEKSSEYYGEWSDEKAYFLQGSRPIILNPVCGDTFLYPENLPIVWRKIDGATKYKLSILSSCMELLFDTLVVSDTLCRISWMWGEGEYFITLRASNGIFWGAFEDTVSVQIEYPVPEILSPSDGDTLEGFMDSLLLRWSGISNNRKRYIVLVSQNQDFTTVDSIVSDTNVLYWTVKYGPVFFWRVKTCINDRCSRYSKAAKITLTGDIPQPIHLEDTVGFLDSLQLSWLPVKTGRKYILEVSTTPGFSSPYVSDTVLNNTNKTVLLEKDGYTYWRVKACMENIPDYCGIWSNTDSFKVLAPVSLMLFPKGDTIEAGDNINIIWQSSGAPGYILYTCFDSICNTVYSLESVNDTVFVWHSPDFGTPGSVIFYFRVKGKNAIYASNFSPNYSKVVVQKSKTKKEKGK